MFLKHCYLLSTPSKSNGRYMIVPEGIQITSIYNFVRSRIGKITVLFCEPNCSFMNRICRVVDEVEGFFCGLLCLSFCRHCENAGLRGRSSTDVESRSELDDI